MPELPEVQSLVDFLHEHAAGRIVTGVELASFSVLKTFDPPPDALLARSVEGVHRLGKHLDLDVDGTHLVIHLARAGWIRWYDEVPTRQVRPGRGPIALRVRFDDGSGFDLTEAGTRKGLAVWITEDPATVPSVARLGPDPLDEHFTEERFAELLQDRRAQIKGLLRDQSVIAGVGNAYSDEILHVARLSPFAPAKNLTGEEVSVLYRALRDTLTEAVQHAAGRPAQELKDAKRSSMRVHGRTGETCPECGDTIAEVSFADRSLQYCPTCQTDGKLLADRRTSKFLK